MSNDKPGPIINQCSPEYKSKCIEWALQTASARGAEEVVNAAKLFYEYVYENK
jgi:hypothetical protein